MGKIYKRKRRSCGLCKPHKLGMAPRNTERQIAMDKVDAEEIRRAFDIAHNARGRRR